MSKGKIRILLADDHTILRIGLASLISREKDMTVVGEAGNGEEAVRLAAELRPDVVIMDLRMPGASGAEATKRIVEAGGQQAYDSKVLILTSFGESAELVEAVANGASGVLLKNTPTRELIETVRRVHAGERVIPKSIEAQLASAARMRLSDRQRLMLELAAKGFTNQEIADRLGLSLITVKKQFSEIFQCLGVANRTEAVAVAR